MIIAITGATGFIGRRLIPRLLEQGHEIRALGRSEPRLTGVVFTPWDMEDEPPGFALEDVSAIIHLAGEPVAQRWSAKVKQRIRDSRVLGTRKLVSAISKLHSRPEIFVAASAIGFYGDRGDETLTENSPPGQDFLAQTCIEWERESRHAGEYGLRVTMLRAGIVLGREGGALATMLPPFRAGIGGPVGSGRQWVSWIHIDDMVEMILFALQHSDVYGPLNATAPNPLRNVDFAKCLGHVLHRPAIMPVPVFALKLMYGEMAKVVLASQRVIPEAATRAGFQFRHTDIESALREILA